MQAESSQSWSRLIGLLRPVHDQARATARRLAGSNVDGDDLFHEALLRAHDRLPSLREDSSFRAWFYSILLSIHRNRTRGGFWKRFSSLEQKRDQGFDPAGEDGAAREEERRQADRASRALACLPAVQRQAVVLFELEGFTVVEIAVMQKVSVSAVKSRLARGRERLRRHYERQGLTPRSESIGVARSEPLSEGGTP
jgi:RNA polymerase sigma-70 factor, ECF subfamily